MAYVTQFDIDQQRENRRNAFAGDVGKAIEGGVKTLEENRRRAIDERRGIEKAAQEEASRSLTDKLNQYKVDQNALPAEQRDDYKKSIDSSKARAGILEKRMGQQEQMKIDAEMRANERKMEEEQRRLDNEKKKGIQKAAIPGFKVSDPDIIPTAKDSETVKKASEGNLNFNMIGNRIVDRLGKLNWKDRIGVTNNWNLLQQDVTEMQMQAKNLYDLGVLNGPDLSLVNKGLGSLNVIELNRLGPEAAQARVKQTIESAAGKLKNAASARGYEKIETNQVVAPEEDNAALEWAQKNPNDPRAAVIMKANGVK